MGCLSHRKKQTEDLAETKWEYISLNDFKSSGCGAPFAYGYLMFLMILSVTFYSVDIFTAVNLLAFNRWASQIDPAIPIDISKWIFSVCIILSIVNLVYEGIRASRVMKRGNVAECYLDSLAVRWESLRFGGGQGFKRFMVFAELTKSKKGTEYIALFTYFSFQSWIRVLICSGPRQFVNAMTLKSVYEAQFAIQNASIGGSITEFFLKIKFIAETDYRQAVILSGMLFTLVVWAFSFLFLVAAVLFYVFFLFHWIPRSDGGLSGYCERKVNKALLKIVTDKVNKALAKGQKKAEMRNAKEFGLERAATLPTLPNIAASQPDGLPKMPVLSRNDTMTTLPAYSPPTATFELGPLDQKRPMPSRSTTMASDATYSSRAPLTASAADMGYGRPASPSAPRLPDIDPPMFPPRPGTAQSQRSLASRPGTTRPGTTRPPPGHAPQQLYESMSDVGIVRPGTTRPPPSHAPQQFESMSDVGVSYGGPAASRPLNNYDRPGTHNNYPGPNPGPRQYAAYKPEGRATIDPYSAPTWEDAPGPGQYGGPMRPSQMPPRSATAPIPPRSATTPMPPRGSQYPPQRSLTGVSSASAYIERSGTPQSTRGPPRIQEDYMERSGTPQNMRGPPRIQEEYMERSATPQSMRGPRIQEEYMERSATPQSMRGHRMQDDYSQEYNQSGRPQPPNQQGYPYGYDVEGQRDRMY
jgi:hypothetical protein